MDIRDLARQGHSTRAIARLTGLSRNTVRKVLRGEHDPTRKDTPRASKIDPFKDYLRGRRAEHPLSAVRLLEEIRPIGYDGSVITLRRFLASLDEGARRREKLTVRFETPPGRQAQADWAHAGRVADAQGRPRPVYAFTFVLSYSRMLYVRSTTSMNLASLIDCHQRAFDYLGGWPQTILYDNMKRSASAPGFGTRRSSTSPTTTASPRGPTGPTGPGPRARSSGPSSMSRTASCWGAPSPTWTTSTRRGWPGWPARPTSASTPPPAGGPWTCSPWRG